MLFSGPGTFLISHLSSSLLTDEFLRLLGAWRQRTNPRGAVRTVCNEQEGKLSVRRTGSCQDDRARHAPRETLDITWTHLLWRTETSAEDETSERRRNAVMQSCQDLENYVWKPNERALCAVTSNAVCDLSHIFSQLRASCLVSWNTLVRHKEGVANRLPGG